MPDTIDTIDLTPDNEGYAAIGAMFVSQLSDDFKKVRRSDSVELLRSVVDIAYAIGYASGKSSINCEELKQRLFSRIGG